MPPLGIVRRIGTDEFVDYLPELGRVGITGATGFIGSHLVRLLVTQGCRPVILIRGENEPGLLGAEWDVVERVRFDPADENLAGVLRQAGPFTTLIHLAGIRSPDAVRCLEVNGLATVRVLQAAVLAGVRRVVIAGSAAEYGSQAGPWRESLPTRPTTSYGISKAMATVFALAMHETCRCPVVIVRPSTVYGPGQPEDMFVAEAVRHAVQGMAFQPKDGAHRQDLVFVDDVVRALVAAATVPGLEGMVFNIGGGRANRLKDIAARIWHISGCEAPLLIGASQESDGDGTEQASDISKARSLLSWEPRFDLDTGLQVVVAAARVSRVDRNQL